MASLTALLEKLLARKDLAEADAAALMRALTEKACRLPWRQHCS